MSTRLTFSLAAMLFSLFVQAQIVINEGSNKNYSTRLDEDREAPDWIELHNAGTEAVDLAGYSLSDDAALPTKWVFPSYILEPGAFLLVFCSGKDRYPAPAFTEVGFYEGFVPDTGLNTHTFSMPFAWNGTDNVMLNVCSYSDAGYTLNSSFQQTFTDYASTIANAQDGSSASCNAFNGGTYNQRPVVQINGIQIGEAQTSNIYTDYPAPYGNWYWGARHQILFRADELLAAGLVAGNFDSLSFIIDSTIQETYTFVQMSLNHTYKTEQDGQFMYSDGSSFHTNFRLNSAGETVYLYAPDETLQSSLLVLTPQFDMSRGLKVDGGNVLTLFDTPTPASSNNEANSGSSFLLAPVLSVGSGVFQDAITVSITNQNGLNAFMRYTLDGSEPKFETGELYTAPLVLTESAVLKVRAFENGMLSSPAAIASYLIGIEHTTPIISVVSTPEAFFNTQWGIFENPFTDWMRAGQVAYFAETENHPLVFEQRTGFRMDGGAGGSRSNPQRSFRLQLADDDFGAGTVNQYLFTQRPERSEYDKLYLRNGSNQWLILPHKDGMQVQMMADSTYNYYSAMRPVSVYINGSYFGLYEQREKFDAQYFETLEGADPDLTDILSLSYYTGSTLYAVHGLVDGFWTDYDAYTQLDTDNFDFWEDADALFDLQYYTDYIAAETFMGNVDWPQNNIKIYRSDKTDYRWRFCVIDLELGMAPNNWTDCNTNMMEYIGNFDPGNPYIAIWQKNILNDRYRNYFINRYADLMNSQYRTERLISVANGFYNQMVPEMTKEFDRWGDPNVPDQDYLNQFEDNQSAFNNEMLCRGAQVRNHIQDYFELPQQTSVLLDVLPAGAGKINISTLTPETYPWDGVYFDGLPIRIEAMANTGFAFSHWLPNEVIDDTLSALFLDTLQSNDLLFQAVFVPFVNANADLVVQDWSLYPSPANTSLTLGHGALANGSGSFEISNMLGSVVLNGQMAKGNTSTQIDVSQLPAGVYVVTLQSGGTQFKPQQFLKR